MKKALGGGSGEIGGRTIFFMYEPNMYATKDELYAFAKEIAKYDGILTVHARACSAVSADYPLPSGAFGSRRTSFFLP